MEPSNTLFTASLFANTLIALAIVWAIVETLKDIVDGAQNGEFHWEKLAAGVLGIVLCILYGIDLLGLLGLQTDVPLVGEIVTGLLFMQGAGTFHDLLKRLMSLLDGAALA